jgi:hypothetical protein
MIQPRRFVLSESAFAAAKAGDGTTLESLGLAEQGVIDPELAHAVAILASAGIALTATALIPGQSTYRRMNLVAPAGADDFVAVGGGEDLHDIVWLGSSTAAAVHIADFLGLASPGASSESRTTELSREAWFGLCALADAIAIQRTRAQLEGRPPTPMTRELLDSAATEANPYRATFASVRLAPPGDVRPDSGVVPVLAEANLVTTPGDIVAPTPLGELLTETLNQALIWGQLLVATTDGSGVLTTVRALTNCLVLGWNADGTACSVTVHSPPAAVLALHQVISEMVERSVPQVPDGPAPVASPEQPRPVARFCANCGSQLSPTGKFCPACGNPAAP